MTAPALTPRGTTRCRACDREGLVSVLDLGEQPLANEMALSQDVPDPEFPLHLMICPDCGLGQIGEYVLPERIFGRDYPYLSSVSESWMAHSGAYAAAMKDALALGESDLVLEIASNDGYLLSQVRALGPRVLGVEPAEGVADLAREKGVPTVSEFFGEDLARRLVAEHGHPRLVAANNVMAHVPDLVDFATGLAVLCDEHTVVTVENPSFLNLLRECQFDTIYHEHFSYLTAHALGRLATRVGLRLVRVEALPTHGGSNRYWFVRREEPAHESVATVVDEELSGGLLDPTTWTGFAERARHAVGGLRTWLDERAAKGRVVAGYGAAAKGNTLMNAAGVTARDLVAVVDGSVAKQGKFLPGSQVPVLEPERLAGCAPDDVLILPWNIAPEISASVARRVPSADCWAAIPTMRRIDG